MPCRRTLRAAEKRQRVLISSRYEEALQDVSQQLADVKDMLQTLTADGRSSTLNKQQQQQQQHHATPGSGRGETAAAIPSPSPRTLIDEQVPTLSGVHEGYNGDSSFQSHAHRIEDALETVAVSELLQLAAPRQQSHPGIFTATVTSATKKTPGSHPRQEDLTSLDNLPLPPTDVVLGLLRLTRTAKQRFFIDFQLLTEDEFADACRDVYFATQPTIPLWSWVTCNVGLYFLFLGLDDESAVRLGTTVDNVRGHCGVLMENAEEAMQSLRMCSEPSLELCRALALLATFYVKLGHSTVAWRLISGAARAALDLGLHRLQGSPEGQRPDPFAIFWYIYSWDKGLAITCGRAPTIHHYDVTTRGPDTVHDREDVATRVYCAFIEFAIVTGEIQRNLFSATAHLSPHSERMRHVDEFAARLRSIQASVLSVEETDTGYSEHFRIIANIINIQTYSLLAMVYRLLPPAVTPHHPLQCAGVCVDAARRALEELVCIGEAVSDTMRWNAIVNLLMSLVPFVSFIILAGNAIATATATTLANSDLQLLSSVLTVISRTAETSPLARRIHDACERFLHIARVIVSAATKGQDGITIDGGHAASSLTAQMDQQVYLEGQSILAEDAEPASLFPMALEDWDSVMLGHEAEFGANFDARALTGIIEPYFANSGW